MLLNKIIGICLHIITIICTAVSQSDQHEVDIICLQISENFEIIGELQTCKTNSSLSVANFNTKVGKLQSTSEEPIAVDFIEAFYIDSAPDLKFLPSGMKSIFPKLKALKDFNSGLMYLDVQDMKQFGSDLSWVRFLHTKLTVLESDLFKFNPNLVYVDFEGNPLKYIDPGLFTGLKQMIKLEVFDLRNCGCMSKVFKKSEGHDIQSFEWNATKCNDTSAKKSHMEISNKKIRAEHGTTELPKINIELRKVDEIHDDIRNEFQLKVDELLESLNSEIRKIDKKIEELDKRITNIGYISSKFDSINEKLEKVQKDNEAIQKMLF